MVHFKSTEERESEREGALQNGILPAYGAKVAISHTALMTAPQPANRGVAADRAPDREHLWQRPLSLRFNKNTTFRYAAHVTDFLFESTQTRLCLDEGSLYIMHIQLPCGPKIHFCIYKVLTSFMKKNCLCHMVCTMVYCTVFSFSIKLDILS